ncbi:FAD-dependent oxidoreductase [Streptomyces sp. B6B3]|uniref:FAD-dependent oxidoreductase n=1 Tax=Streptomyces sp. B6B3 TaxID=3153570 RepID=UPI00325E6EA6
MLMLRTDLLVVGGGLGGVAAALTAAEHGINVIVTEQTDWLGGVLTSQAVPPDEHPWIEQFGCTRTYRRFRDDIRDYYRRHYPLVDSARRRPDLNPGDGRVSALCFEPRVGVRVIEAMLAPFVSSGRLRVLLEHQPTAAHADGDRVMEVVLRDARSGEQVSVTADWFVDATDTGELLPLCGVEHVMGAEARADTGEPHAAERSDPLNMQPISVCFALDHVSEADFTIAKPDEYEEFLTQRWPDWPEGQLSFLAPEPKTRRVVKRGFLPNPPPDAAREGDRELWLFRRIANRQNFTPGAYDTDITLVNWPQMDYWGGPIIGVAEEQAAEHLRRAKALSLSLLYWLQTAAPRPDGGTGWPGLRLRGDVVGDTTDGLAKAPYVRESRRIKAERTVVEQDIALDVRGDHGAVAFPDTVGLGSYRIDLHPSTGGDPYIDIGCCPFQLPLGALLPVRVDNLLPAAKNIGTTHITNGCYRMPLVEWNVGEVAAHLVSYCTAHRMPPRAVRAKPDHLDAFQQRLIAAGVELSWPPVHGY